MSGTISGRPASLAGGWIGRDRSPQLIVKLPHAKCLADCSGSFRFDGDIGGTASTIADAMASAFRASSGRR